MSSDYPYEGATFGDYQLVRGLGRRGFADVYLGTDITGLCDVLFRLLS